MDKGADISDCGRYRYRLWRWWDDAMPMLGFIMLNPSTADADQDDPTVRKCMGFARRWGYGGIMVTNLYGLRSTNPRLLWRAEDPVGPDNDGFLIDEARACAKTIAAWGNHGRRSDRVRGLLQWVGVPLYHLGLNKTGQPKHPLYLPYATTDTDEWHAPPRNDDRDST